MQPPEQYRYAGFWIRFVAAVLDGLVVQVSLVIIYIGISLTTPGVENTPLLDIFSIFGTATYHICFIASKKQASLGKMAMGIYVVNANYEKLSLANSIGRCFAQILSAIPLMVGYMLAGWNKQKRALHDFVANTYVVYGKPGEPA